MEILQVSASHGWQWIQDGFWMMKRKPLVWTSIFFVYLLISLSLYLLLPFIGLIIFYLIDPLFVAGFMIGCKALDGHHKLEMAHLFSAFKHNAGRLVTIGGFNLLSRVLVFGVMGMLFVNSGYSTYLDKIEQGNYEWLFTANMELSVLAFLGILVTLMLPLYMAYWFSPAVVEFDEVEPFDAIRLSLKACFTNVKAFTVYALSFVAVMSAFFLLVALVGALLGWVSYLLGSGVVFKVLISYIGLILALLCWVGAQALVATSQYMSYKAIFRSTEDASSLMAM